MLVTEPTVRLVLETFIAVSVVPVADVKVVAPSDEEVLTVRTEMVVVPKFAVPTTVNVF